MGLAALGLVLAASVHVWALFDSTLYISPASRDEMRERVRDPDFLTFVVLYDSAGENSQLVAPIIEKVAENYHHFIRFLGIDCTNDDKVCPKDVRPRLPALTAYIPMGLNPYTGKPWVTTKDYKGAISPRELSEFLLDHMPFLGDTPNAEALRAIMADGTLNKTLLFTDKTSISPLFRAAASKFRGRLEFAVVWKNQTEILQEYSVSAFPTILAKDAEGLHTYNGEINFEDLCGFLQPFASEEKVYIRRRKTEGTPEKESDSSVVKITADELELVLEDTKQVVVALFHSRSVIPEWEFLTERLQGIVVLAEVKVTTVSEVKKYGVSKLPSVRVFPVNRKRNSFELSLTDEIEAEIAKELKGVIEPVNDVSINKFVERVKDEKSIGCFVLSDQRVPLAVKAIAADSFFAEEFRFAYYNRRKEEMLKMLTAKRFPTFLCFVVLSDKGEMKVMEFEGSMERFGELNHFLDQVILPGLGKTQLPRKEVELEEVQQWDTDSFAEDCLQKGGFCVLAFLDGPIVPAI